MKKVGIIIVIILAFVLTAPVSAAVGVQTEPTEVKDNFCLEIENEIDTRRTQVGYFTENLGQWDTELDFVATTSFGYIGLGRQNAFYYLVDSEDDDLNVLKYTFETSTEITPKGLDPLSHRSNYFYGNNPDLWVTDVKSYSTILYENLWDNIDLRYSMGQQGLKYELVARPGSELIQKVSP